MAPSVITLRPAVPRDREAAVDLIQRLVGFAPDVASDHDRHRQAAESQYNGLLERSARSAGRLVLAEAGGRVVALMSFTIEEDAASSTEELRRYGMVVDLLVLEEYRAQGVPGLLLAEAERLTRQEGLQRLVVTTLAGSEDADAYQSFGFEPFLMIMVKPLDD